MTVPNIAGVKRISDSAYPKKTKGYMPVDDASTGQGHFLIEDIFTAIAPEFKPAVACVAGKCYWNPDDGYVYRCIVAHTGTWNPDHFTRVPLSEVVTMAANLLGTASTDADMDSSHALTLVTNDGTQTKLPANLVAKANEQAALTTYAQNVAHSIAPEFDPTRDYVVDESCTYGGKAYIFTSDHPAGAWNPAHATISGQNALLRLTAQNARSGITERTGNLVKLAVKSSTTSHDITCKVGEYNNIVFYGTTNASTTDFNIYLEADVVLEAGSYNLSIQGSFVRTGSVVAYPYDDNNNLIAIGTFNGAGFTTFSVDSNVSLHRIMFRMFSPEDTPASFNINGRLQMSKGLEPKKFEGYENAIDDNARNSFSKLDSVVDKHFKTLASGIVAKDYVTPINITPTTALDGDGSFVPNSSYELIKYKVTEGQLVYIKADAGMYAAFQFSTSSNVSKAELVGNPVIGPVDDAFVVPSTATYLIVCRKTTDTTNGLYTKVISDGVKNYINKLVDAKAVAISTSPGYINGDGSIAPAGTNTKELVTDFIDVSDNKLYSFVYKLYTGAPWLGYCFYDENQQKVGSRIILSDFPLIDSYSTGIASVRRPDGAKYLRVSFRTYDSYYFEMAKEYDIGYIEIARDKIDMDQNVERKKVNEFFKCLFAKTHYYSHLFIDTINYSQGWPFPCQSLECVNAEKRLGFRVVEGNVHKTCTPGKYIVMHGTSGIYIGQQLYDPNNTDISGLVISETPFDTLRTYKYRNPYQNGRTTVVSLEEYLSECKKNNLVPLLYYADSTALSIAQSYFGDNFILYCDVGVSERPAGFNGLCMVYKTITSVSSAKSVVSAFGSNVLVMPANSLSDAMAKDIIDTLHGLGAMYGHIGVYSSEASIQKYLSFGCDVVASGWNVPFDESGNLDDFFCYEEFDEVTTDGTIANNAITLTNGQTVSFTSAKSCFLGKEQLTIRFSGSISLTMGRKIQSETLTSDGVGEMKISSYVASQNILSNVPAFSLTALGDVTIYSIGFKASRC